MNDIIKQTANQLEYPEYLVRYVVNHYCKEVKKTIHHPEYNKIELGGLGCFIVDKHQLNMKVLKTYKKIIKYTIKNKQHIVDIEKSKFKLLWSLRNKLNKVSPKLFKYSIHKRNLTNHDEYRIYKKPGI